MKTQDGQNQRNSNNRSERLGESQRKSGRLGDESNQAVDLDSQRANFNKSNCIRRRRKVIGGILSQLILDLQDQLALHKTQIKFHENEMSKIKKRLEYLEGLNIAYNDPSETN